MNRCSGYNECMWEPRGACAQQTHRDIRASQKTSPPLTSHSPSCFHLSLGFFFTVRINRTTLVPFYFLYRCCCCFFLFLFFSIRDQSAMTERSNILFHQVIHGFGLIPSCGSVVLYESLSDPLPPKEGLCQRFIWTNTLLLSNFL